MKRIITLALILIALTVIYGVESHAQTRQIQFAKGKSSATVKGNTGKYGAYYAIRAKRGQVLIIDLSPNSKVGIRVETETPDGQVVLLEYEEGGHYEIPLGESGDYTIIVSSNSVRPVPFALSVKIRK